MASVLLDGVDITSLCTVPNPEGGGRPIRWNRRGGRPSSLTVQGPGHLLGGTVGVSTLELTGIGAGFTGVVWRSDDRGDEDATHRTLLGFDPTIYFPKRIVKDGEDSVDALTGDPDPGNFSDPSIIEDHLYGPAIMAAAISNSISLDGSFGPTGLGVGGISLNHSVDLTGSRPSSWPMTLDGLRAMLSDGGVLDYIVNGTTIDLYEGNAGNDLTGSVSFGYGTGAFNCKGAERSIDMDNVFTVIWSLLGPKEPLYDNDVQHWKGNVTIDDSPLGPNGGIDETTGEYYGIPDPPFSDIASLVLAARGTYGRLQTVDEYDAYTDERTPAAKRRKRRLYQMLWLAKSLYCSTPRNLVKMSPEAGIAPAFDVYDLIAVAATSDLGGGFSGEQRVYEFTCEIDTEGNPELTDIVVSADQG